MAYCMEQEGETHNGDQKSEQEDDDEHILEDVFVTPHLQNCLLEVRSPYDFSHSLPDGRGHHPAPLPT